MEHTEFDEPFEVMTQRWYVYNMKFLKSMPVVRITSLGYGVVGDPPTCGDCQV